MSDGIAPLLPDRPAPRREAVSTSSESPTFRQRVHDMVEGTLDTWFEWTLLGVIFVNVISLVVSTVPTGKGEHCFGESCERLGVKYKVVFESVEWISVAAFSLEYIMRIWACVEDPKTRRRGPVLGRLAYAMSFYPLIDLVSILPNWISLVTFVVDPFFEAHTSWQSPDFTAAGRIVRLVRIFKTDKYLCAFALLGDVLWENRILLFATSFYSGMMWIIAATLLFYTERNNKSDEMRPHFQSIPLSMFPTLLMLTGEFPLSEFTPMGQVVSGLVAVVAVAIFAVPTSVLGAGFMKAVQQAQHREFTLEMD